MSDKQPGNNLTCISQKILSITERVGSYFFFIIIIIEHGWKMTRGSVREPAVKSEWFTDTDGVSVTS